MLTTITDFNPFVKHKLQILSNRLHNELDSEILHMLEYEGFTDKSVAYLLDYGAVVGFVYIEHFRNRSKDRGTFGMYVHPSYRDQGYATMLATQVQKIAEDNGFANQPMDVSEKALTIFKRAFGDDYPIAEILTTGE